MNFDIDIEYYAMADFEISFLLADTSRRRTF